MTTMRKISMESGKNFVETRKVNLFGATRSKFATEVNDVKICKPSMQSQRRGEGPSFDALQTLADLSSMMPTENGDGSKLQLNYENVDHVDDSVLEALPMNQQKRTCRSSRVKTEGHKSVSSIEVACRKTSKSGKGSVIDVRSIPEENQDPLSSMPKRTRKKQKIHVSEIQKTEARHDIQFSESPGIEEAVVLELRHMNDDVVGNQKNGDRSLNDTELFKKKNDAVLTQSSEANEEVQIPSELITKCLASLLMIQNCTERRVPPSDIAQILDSAIMSLHPCSSHNLPIYTEIQRCMGIIRNQITALIPTYCH